MTESEYTKSIYELSRTVLLAIYRLADGYSGIPIIVTALVDVDVEKVQIKDTSELVGLTPAFGLLAIAGDIEIKPPNILLTQAGKARAMELAKTMKQQADARRANAAWLN